MLKLIRRSPRHGREIASSLLSSQRQEKPRHCERSEAISSNNSRYLPRCCPCRKRGRRIVNSVYSPLRLSTSIVPPCCWVTMSQLIDRPSPVPLPVGLVVKNGWNNLSLTSGAMPVPLSRTL